MDTFHSHQIPADEYDPDKTVALAGGSQQVADQLTLMLADSLDKASSLINDAHAQQDFAAIQAEAHKLHGGLCYVSAPKLLYLTQHLEYACKINAAQTIEEIIPLFYQAADQLKTRLRGC